VEKNVPVRQHLDADQLAAAALADSIDAAAGAVKGTVYEIAGIFFDTADPGAIKLFPFAF